MMMPSPHNSEHDLDTQVVPDENHSADILIDTIYHEDPTNPQNVAEEN
jgi:hypothetical protein